jgi:predicted trehalose synthase
MAITAPTGQSPGPHEPRNGRGPVIPDAAITDPRFLNQVARWLSVQRWYAGKGRLPKPTLVGRIALPATGGATGIGILVILDETEHRTLYQLPLTAHPSPLPGLESALVATLDGETPQYLYDGPHDPAFASALLRLVLDETTAVGAPDRAVGIPHPLSIRGHLSFEHPRFEIVSSRVFGGEQSNSSIIYELADAAGAPLRPVICKLFRALQPGDNPEVELLDALGAAGSRAVPQSLGYLNGQWADAAGGTASGQLAFAQEFLPDVEDAWTTATRAAEDGRDFTAAARALGEATAEVHEILARALGTTATTPADIAASTASMMQRLGLAIAEVPALTPLRERIEAVYARAAASPWPPMQRIHGDLHLGQALDVPGRGWVLLDFEGEPLRPMAERNRPDLPLRDVAGMLRSFDYVAGARLLAGSAGPAGEWESACRRAYVNGYSARSGHDLSANQVLLDALEIDKAVYEAIYEARNRPDWLPIPVTAITRLAERATAGRKPVD